MSNTDKRPFTRPIVSLDRVVHGNVEFKYDVDGFWSNPCSLYMRRKFIWREEELEATAVVDRWEFEIRHSSGGYDSDADPLKSDRNMALAMLDAYEFAQELKDNLPYYEQMYQLREEQEQIATEKRRAERQAVIDADPAMPESVAKDIIAQLRDDVKTSDKYYATSAIEVRKRGESWEPEKNCYHKTYERFLCRNVGYTGTARIQWRCSGEVVSEKYVIEQMCGLANDYKLELAGRTTA